MRTAKFLVFTFMLAALIPSDINAQESKYWRFQNRDVLHVQYDLSDELILNKFFLAGWFIGNVKQNSNINLLGGVGYRGENWWLESMIQKQWSERDTKLLFDNRFQLSAGKSSVYVEVAPFLSSKAVYDMVIVDRTVWRKRKLNVGFETENVHFESKKDSLGIGPRVCFPVGSLGKFNLAVAFAYQFRRQESNLFRYYLIFSRRFKR